MITPIYFHNPGKNLLEHSIAWLIKHGYTFISESELIAILDERREFPRGAVWLSFDDGYKEWTENVLPVLSQYRVPATFFIPTGIISGNRRFPWLHRDETSDDQARPIAHTDAVDSLSVDKLLNIAQFSEIAFGGHTVSHAITTRCADEELRFEIGGCKTSLQSWAPTAPASFAYPAGCVDGRERKHLIEAGFAIAATTEPSFIGRQTDPMLIPRFCVPDDASMPEAICNMTGEWQGVIRMLKRALRVE